MHTYSNDAVNDATFYDYKIIKKSTGVLHDFYFSKFNDTDIGDTQDDFIDCDTTLNYGFSFNGDSDDPDYGTAPPIFITQFAKTPSNTGISSFIYFDRLKAFPQNDPTTAENYRTYQLGLWKDSTPLHLAGIPTNPITKYAYSGNPGGADSYWSECNNDNLGTRNQNGDRRMVMTSGPYDLYQNQPLEFTIAVMVAPTNQTVYNGCPDKISLINPIVNLVDSFLDTVSNIPRGAPTPIYDIQNNDIFVNIYPNPSNDYMYIDIDEHIDIVSLEIFDINGSLIEQKSLANRIDIRNFSKGIYTIRLFTKNKEVSIYKKIIVQ